MRDDLSAITQGDREIDALFHALADATRRDILRRCLDQEPSVSRLAAAYPVSNTAIQKHVKVLEDAGLVTRRKQGREQLVSTRFDGLAQAHQALDRLEAAWRARIEQMDDILAGESGVAPPHPKEHPMAVTGIEKDFDALTLRLTAEFAAPIEAVWQLWADPRKLERWWGPPTRPATFVDHDLSAGGRATYYMTGPDGTKSAGWWQVESVDPPTSLAFRDGFSDADGKPVDSLPETRSEVRLSTEGDTTVMTLVSHFASQDSMETALAMGLEEGLGLSVGQMDALLDGTAGTH